MSEIETAVNSLRAMDLPKGAESLLSTILSKAGTLETEQDKLKRALDKREDDNKGYRDTIKTLTDERDELKGQLPKDGSRVLPKAEADRYDAFLALNLKPDEIKTKLEAGSEAQQKAHRADTREALRKLGYEPTERLLKDFDGVSLVVTEGEDKKPVGKVKAGEDEQVFGDWAQAQGLAEDLARYRTEPGKPPVYTGRGNPGGSVADPVESYNQQTYGTKK